MIIRKSFQLFLLFSLTALQYVYAGPTGGSIPAGTRVVITEISEEDSYFDTKEDYLGKTGVVTGSALSPSAEGEGWYGGTIDIDGSDDSPYFYAVAVELVNKGASTGRVAPVREPVKTAALPESIPEGTRVYITDISEEDSYYDSKEDYLGKSGVVVDGDLTSSGEDDGWYGGSIAIEGESSTPYFYEVAVSLDKPEKAGSSMAVKGVTGPTLAKGTKVTILDISPEDSYYGDKSDYIGQTGVVKETLSRSSVGDGWFGGSIQLDNGNSPYFYAVALASGKVEVAEKRPVTTASVKGITGATLAKGTRITIVDVSPEDSYYSDKEEYIGQTGIVKETLSRSGIGDGWFGGSIQLDNGNSPYFYAVAVTKSDAKNSEKSPRPETASVIPKGSKIEIIDISPEDSYYSSKASHIGKQGIVLKADLSTSSVGKGWYSGEIKMDSNSGLGSPYYYAVAVRIIK